LLVVAFHVQWVVAVRGMDIAAIHPNQGEELVGIHNHHRAGRGESRGRRNDNKRNRTIRLALRSDSNASLAQLRGGGPPSETRDSNKSYSNSNRNSTTSISRSRSNSNGEPPPLFLSYCLPQTITVRITTLNLPAILVSVRSLCQSSLARLQGLELAARLTNSAAMAESYAVSSRSESAGVFGTSSQIAGAGAIAIAGASPGLLAAALFRRTLAVLLLAEALDRTGVLGKVRERASRMAVDLEAAWTSAVLPALARNAEGWRALLTDLWAEARQRLDSASDGLWWKDVCSGKWWRTNKVSLRDCGAFARGLAGTYRRRGGLWTPRSAFALGTAAGTMIGPLLPSRRLRMVFLAAVMAAGGDRGKTLGAALQTRCRDLAARVADARRREKEADEYHLGYSSSGTAAAMTTTTTTTTATAASQGVVSERHTAAVAAVGGARRRRGGAPFDNSGYSLGIASWTGNGESDSHSHSHSLYNHHHEIEARPSLRASTNTDTMDARLEALRQGFAWGFVCATGPSIAGR